MKILIIEDEKQLSVALAEVLKEKKYVADAVYDGIDGLEYALTGNYDIIILDIMLPKLNGLEVLRALREKRNTTPVILLTAKSELRDKVTGLDSGADDYLTKPFSTAELLARIRALQRRKETVIADSLQFGGLELNIHSFELAANGQRIRLGAKEYSIMECLFSAPIRIWSKEQLTSKVWGYETDADYNAVEVYISFLRKKLAAIHSPVTIKAMRNIGYCLEKIND